MGLYSETFTYTDTGTKDEVRGYTPQGILGGGTQVGTTVACSGGASDVYKIQEKIGGTWHDSLSSSSGVIVPTRITGINEGMRIVITTNTSGSIKFSISGK